MRIMRISFVGELGHELHIANEHCVPIYRRLVEINQKYGHGLNDAGFRAYNSLNCEAGVIEFNMLLQKQNKILCLVFFVSLEKDFMCGVLI